jgi:hypothetical protein
VINDNIFEEVTDFTYLWFRISEYKSDLEDKLQIYNKINGAIRRHFGKQTNKETKLRIHNITAVMHVKFTLCICTGKKLWNFSTLKSRKRSFIHSRHSQQYQLQSAVPATFSSTSYSQQYQLQSAVPATVSSTSYSQQYQLQSAVPATVSSTSYSQQYQLQSAVPATFSSTSYSQQYQSASTRQIIIPLRMRDFSALLYNAERNSVNALTR